MPQVMDEDRRKQQAEDDPAEQGQKHPHGDRDDPDRLTNKRDESKKKRIRTEDTDVDRGSQR